jgi:anaerobic selenocysteine-containing dehydrogenase/ferredoxin-NADP reductase
VYEVEGGALTGVRPDPQHPTGAALCPKGRAAPEIAHSPRRLQRPLRRTRPKSDPDPGWEEISWEAALGEVAGRLDAVRAESGPEAVAFAVASPSGSPLSDSIDWIERFIRLFGSPNTCYSTEVCNWHKDFAHAFTFGRGLPPPDCANTDLAVLWGHNPSESWLAQSAALAEARERGARLAVVDPRRSTSARRADHWLRVLPGTDAALALGTANLVLQAGGCDEAFLRSWSDALLLVRADTGRHLRAEEIEPGAAGFAVWNERSGAAEPCDTRFPPREPESCALRGRRMVRTSSGLVECVPAFELYARACEEWPLDRTASVTSVDGRGLREFADALMTAESVAYYSWTGLGQHTNATQTDRAVATLFALTGSFDAPGGNVVLPALGTNHLTSPDQIAPQQRARALGADRLPLGPPAQGWVTARDLCSAITSGEPYPVRTLVGFGSNLLLSQPDPRRTAEALRQLEFHVHLDLFATPTSEFADVVLPVNSPWEHDGLRAGFEISQRAQEHVQYRPRMVEPVGQSRSDAEVVFDLAQRLGLGGAFFGGDLEAARNHWLAPLGVTVQELRESPGGTRIPLETRYRKYAERSDDGEVAGFGTPTRRVELVSERLAEHGHSPVPVHEPAGSGSHPLVLTCAKNGYFCHSQHRGLSSLRKRSPEPVVDLGPELARARGIEDGQLVELATRNSSVRMRARIDPDLHPEVVVAEHGWWQDAPDLALGGSDPLRPGGTNYNLLIDDEQHDPVSGSVPMRSTRCDVRPVASAEWSGRRTFEVTAVVRETEDVRTVHLEPVDGGPIPEFRPGQHIGLSDPDSGLAGTYSLIGPARGGSSYEVSVRRVPGGRFSTLVHDVFAPGRRVHATAPAGGFALPVDLQLPVVLVAAGIGITPFLSYLETAAERGSTAPEIVLHHGNRDAATHAFRDRIAELQQRVPQLRVVDHYSRAAPEGVRHGRITADDIDPELIRDRARFYLCGPGPMLDDLVSGLVARGVPRFAVFTERFRAAARDVDVPASATVHFSRSGRELRWSGRETLLALAERAGLRLPSGCRVGQCESCAVTVLDGSVAHLVAPTEDLPADQCLTCQAVPAEDLTLDA